MSKGACLLVILASFSLSGCSSLGDGSDRSIISDLALDYAVAKTVEQSDSPLERIQKVRDIAQAVRADESGAQVEQLIREQISWGSLSPVDRQYLHSAIVIAAERIELQGVDAVADRILRITERLEPIYAAGGPP